MFRSLVRFLFGLASLSVCSAGSLAATTQKDLRIEVAPGVHIHAVEAGSGQGKPALVLIPGWGFSGSVWARQIDNFARERHVIALDPRSQGQSTKTPEGNTPEERARDLSKLLDHLALPSVVLVGWSQGVQDVAAYVGQFSTSRVKGIVLVDAPVSLGAPDIANHPQSAAQELRLLALYAKSPGDYIEGMMHAIIKRPLAADELHRLVVDAMQTPTAIGEAMLVSDLFGADRSPTLAKFDRPTLVVAASDSDELEAQEAMVAKLPQGRIVTVKNAGHAVFIDQPDRFDSIIAEFIGTL
jgi:pimeloyl-ACP methyl ester carboxylesterase